MKVKTKEELVKALIELRKGKEKQESYHVVPPSMAMCYSIAFPRYRTGHFIGKHKCICCNENFGTDCDDEIAICQEKRYQEYLKSQYLFFYDYPCFNEFFEKYNKQNQEIINYLNKNKLKFVNHNQYSNYPEYGRLRIRDEFINKDNVVSFNRILTKEEWVKLNTNCKKNHCFSIDSTYETYQNVYEKYIAAGYDVKLEYNCPKCCSNGKNEIEFWFRFNDEDEYVISKPVINKSGLLNYTTYSEYMIALEFLNGCQSYKELLKKSFDRDEGIKKSQIDNALNKIVGTNIKYDKKEIYRYINQFYKILKYDAKEQEKLWPRDRKTEAQVIEENILTHCILDIFDNVLSMYEDSYEFSLTEYFVLMENVAEIKDYKMKEVDIASRAEIVEKRTIYYIKNIDKTLSNKAIYGYLEVMFPKGKIITESSSKYEIESSKTDDITREIVYGIFELIFENYGKEYQIKVSLFDRILDYFEENYWVGFSLEKAYELKNSILTKEFIDRLIEEK